METKNSALHLIPVPLTGSTTSYLSTESIETAHKIIHFIVENAKSARQFLKSINHPTPLQSIEIEIITDKPKENWQWVKSILEKGLDVGILSEAGLPAVADPGNEIVKIAHQNLCKVITHSGPNSMITALMASGMNGQQFIFHGYLPAKKEQLREKLIQIVKSHNYPNFTHIFMETPYRNKQVMEIIFNNVPNSYLLSISANLHTKDEINYCKTIAQWKVFDSSIFLDAPAIFCFTKN